MHKTDNLYCLILAGGKGRRLWPESRTDMPKQFIDFFGSGQTMLQSTYNRFVPFISPDHILISTNVQYADLVREQLPDVPERNILAEPIWRNTGPSIAWGAHRIYHFCNDAEIIITPCDQLIIDEDTFSENVIRGQQFVSENKVILTLGITPTRPEPGYGYLQMRDEVGQDIFSIQSFTEKPEREFAQMFMQSGEFLWNSGMYMSRADCLLEMFYNLLPNILRKINASDPDFSTDDENDYVMNNFSSYPNISIEKGIIEKMENVDVMHCNFGWADLGTWHSFYDAEQHAEGENIVLDSDVILDNSHNNIIKVPRGHLAVINGLNGYIVVEKGDVLLICPKEDSSALIRKYSAEVEIR